MTGKKRYYKCIVRRNLVDSIYGVRKSKSIQEKNYYEDHYEHQLKIFSEALEITSEKLDRKIKRYIKVKDCFVRVKLMFNTNKVCKDCCLFCKYFDKCGEKLIASQSNCKYYMKSIKHNSFKCEIKRFFNKFKHMIKTRKECKSCCLFCNYFDYCVEELRRLL